MKLTVQKILENTNNKELSKLFNEFLDRIVESNKDTGIFCVDDNEKIFPKSDTTKIIKKMKKWGYTEVGVLGN